MSGISTKKTVVTTTAIATRVDSSHAVSVARSTMLYTIHTYLDSTQQLFVLLDTHMQQSHTDQSVVSPDTTTTARRPFLRALATAGVFGAVGLPALTDTVGAAIPGVPADFKRCKVTFVSNASVLDRIAVYYADRTLRHRPDRHRPS